MKTLKPTWHEKNTKMRLDIEWNMYVVGKTKHAPRSNPMSCAFLHIIAQNKKRTIWATKQITFYCPKTIKNSLLWTPSWLWDANFLAYLLFIKILWCSYSLNKCFDGSFEGTRKTAPSISQHNKTNDNGLYFVSIHRRTGSEGKQKLQFRLRFMNGRRNRARLYMLMLIETS